MRLTEAQSRALLAKHGVYVIGVCNECGKILGHVRFTRYGEPGEWCSRECRDGAGREQSNVGVKPGLKLRPERTRRGGRPRKYRTDRERRVAERQQDAIRHRAYRKRRNVTENPPASGSFYVSTEAKNRPLAIPVAGERA